MYKHKHNCRVTYPTDLCMYRLRIQGMLSPPTTSLFGFYLVASQQPPIQNNMTNCFDKNLDKEYLLCGCQLLAGTPFGQSKLDKHET